MAATVNPCGFALLPAYLAAFVGHEHRGGRFGAVGRAFVVSVVLTAGFVLVFGSFGLIVTPLALRIEEHLPWVTVVIGIGLVGLGAAMLAGRQVLVNLPKLNKGGRDGTLPSMFLFGVSYAVASLSCTIAPFLAVTTSTFRTENLLAGLAVFVAYGVGMGVVIAVLTVAVALVRTGAANRFRKLLPLMHKVAGGFLLIAGTYVAYYGWYEIRVLDGARGDPVIDRAIEFQTWLQNTVVPDDPTGFAIVAIGSLTTIALAAALMRDRRPAGAATLIGPSTFTSDKPERAPTACTGSAGAEKAATSR